MTKVFQTLDSSVTIRRTDEYDLTPKSLKENHDNVRSTFLWFRECVATEHIFTNYDGEIAFWDSKVLNDLVHLGTETLSDPITKEKDQLGEIILLGNTQVLKNTAFPKGLKFTMLAVDRCRNPDYDGSTFLLSKILIEGEAKPRHLLFSWQNVYETKREEILPLYTAKYKTMCNDGSVASLRKQILAERKKNYTFTYKTLEQQDKEFNASLEKETGVPVVEV